LYFIGKKSDREALKLKAQNLTPQQSDGLPYETRLQVGAVYFISTNINVEDGLFNGATGVLKKIEYSINWDPRRA